MKIIRHCHERLMLGEKTWRQLAAASDFDGKLYVYGYGVGGQPGASQRRAKKGEQATIGDHLRHEIRVWMRCSCQEVRGDFDLSPLWVFAHELGHFRAWKNHKANTEETADRYARRLLKKFELSEHAKTPLERS